MTALSFLSPNAKESRLSVNPMNLIPMNKSIRAKVIWLVSGSMALAMLFISIIVTILIYRHMGAQMESLLQNNGYSTQQRLEGSLRYLVDNSEVLAKNELFINALVDEEGRKNYLPLLVKNFMKGKDVISLSVLDFDGRPVFKTQEDIPEFATSENLRTALAMGETDLYLQAKSNNIIVVVPIQYYGTTEGALVVVFDTKAIAQKVIPNDLPASLSLHQNKKVIFHYAVSDHSNYRTMLIQPLEKTPYLSKLDLDIRLGLLESVYLKPLRDVLIPLLAIGLFFVLLGVIISYLLAEKITRPIIALYERIAFTDKNNYTRCSPLGTDDELEILAAAFDERSYSLQHLSKYDLLTGLPNRIFFIDRLENAIMRSERDHTLLAILSLGLDNFKNINDSLGHKIGDDLLIRVSKMLTHQAGSGNAVARFGGDEFIILIENIAAEEQVIDTVDRIISEMKEQMQIENFRFFISISIGIALYPQNGKNAEALLQNADTAMDQAKNEGGGRYQFYNTEMTQAAYDRMYLRNQIQNGILKEEFVVFYQGQVDMRSGELCGMEALIRWNHPEAGLITPFLFISLAEETGQIIEIDRWVMKTAMRQFAQWSKEGYRIGKLSLNLSLLQLKDSNFTDIVIRSIYESGIDPKQLQFEVTETQIMIDPEGSIRMLNELKQLGITLAIDDFGTGQSSLSYLKRLPVDKIKIDQSFIRGIPHEHGDIQLTKTIIAMALNLNFELIAEGVETPEQAQFLIDNGCYEAQGYLYYRPISAEELEVKLVKLDEHPSM